jgi:isopenicillin N synthase-like dioxygenase
MMTVSALTTGASSVPVIDLAQAELDASQLPPLDLACRDHGFFLLKQHGMDAEIEAMWKASEQFFSQPREIKRQILRTESVPLGYYDRELTKQKRDLKEVFDFMSPRPDARDLNQWPAGDEAFKAAQLNFFNAASAVAKRTLALVYRALAQGLDLDPALASLPMGEPRTSNARLNCYPMSDPLSDSEAGEVRALGDMALHHHTDPGILTLLLQDMTGGLQTLTRDEGWLDVMPEAGTIVVNLGDAMQVWTNDVYRAAVHRVVPMTQNTRYSTPYFFNPANDAMLAPLAGLTAEPDRFEAFTWREYIKGRIDDNYTDLGEDDIQIDRFRITA